MPFGFGFGFGNIQHLDSETHSNYKYLYVNCCCWCCSCCCCCSHLRSCRCGVFMCVNISSLHLFGCCYSCFILYIHFIVVAVVSSCVVVAAVCRCPSCLSTSMFVSPSGHLHLCVRRQQNVYCCWDLEIQEILLMIFCVAMAVKKQIPGSSPALRRPSVGNSQAIRPKCTIWWSSKP